jgi:hypothetical protein
VAGGKKKEKKEEDIYIKSMRIEGAAQMNGHSNITKGESRCCFPDIS